LRLDGSRGEEASVGDGSQELGTKAKTVEAALWAVRCIAIRNEGLFSACCAMRAADARDLDPYNSDGNDRMKTAPSLAEPCCAPQA